jgi:hypothetical protein
MAAIGRVAEGRRAVRRSRHRFRRDCRTLRCWSARCPRPELDLAEGRPDAALETIEAALAAGGRHVGLRLSLAAAGLRAAADARRALGRDGTNLPSAGRSGPEHD